MRREDLYRAIGEVQEDLLFRCEEDSAAECESEERSSSEAASLFGGETEGRSSSEAGSFFGSRAQEPERKGQERGKDRGKRRSLRIVRLRKYLAAAAVVFFVGVLSVSLIRLLPGGVGRSEIPSGSSAAVGKPESEMADAAKVGETSGASRALKENGEAADNAEAGPVTGAVKEDTEAGQTAGDIKEGGNAGQAAEAVREDGNAGQAAEAVKEDRNSDHAAGAVAKGADAGDAAMGALSGQNSAEEKTGAREGEEAVLTMEDSYDALPEEEALAQTEAEKTGAASILMDFGSALGNATMAPASVYEEAAEMADEEVADEEKTGENSSLFQGEYKEEEDFRIVSLKLNGGGTLWLFLPEEGKTPEEILREGEWQKLLSKQDGEASAETEKSEEAIRLILPEPRASAEGEQTIILTPENPTFAAAASAQAEMEKESSVTPDRQMLRLRIGLAGEGEAVFALKAVDPGDAEQKEIREISLDQPVLFVVTDQEGKLVTTGVANEE